LKRRIEGCGVTKTRRVRRTPRHLRLRAVQVYAPIGLLGMLTPLTYMAVTPEHRNEGFAVVSLQLIFEIQPVQLTPTIIRLSTAFDQPGLQQAEQSRLI